MKPNEINNSICKFLGIDIQDVTEVYLRLHPEKYPEVMIRKFIKETQQEDSIMLKVVPLDKLSS